MAAGKRTRGNILTRRRRHPLLSSGSHSVSKNNFYIQYLCTNTNYSSKSLTRKMHIKSRLKNVCHLQRTDASFPWPSSPPEAAAGAGAEDEWTWRSGAKEIRGERQKRVSKSEVRKKTLRSHSWGVSEYRQVTRTAPSSGGCNVYNHFTVKLVPGRIRKLPTSEISVFFFPTSILKLNCRTWQCFLWLLIRISDLADFHMF